jgi:hypothetical protein
MNTALYAWPLILAAAASALMADSAEEPPSAPAAQAGSEGKPPREPAADRKGNQALPSPAEASSSASSAPKLQVARVGRLLTLNWHAMREAEADQFGLQPVRPPAPRFTVSQNGRQIGEGQFEYG